MMMKGTKRRRRALRRLKNMILKCITSAAVMILLMVSAAIPETDGQVTFIIVTALICTAWILLFGWVNGYTDLPDIFQREDRKYTDN